MEQIKAWMRFRKREILLGAIIFFASSLAFALGYLANRELDHAPIIIRTCSDIAKENPL